MTTLPDVISSPWRPHGLQGFVRREEKKASPRFSPDGIYQQTLLSDKNSRPFQFIKFAKEGVMFLLISDEI